MACQIGYLSTRYVEIPGVEAFDPDEPDGANNADPTGFPVYFAFLPVGTDPTGPDWHAGSWKPGRTDTVRYLLTPSTFTLAKGIYAVWTKIVGTVETDVHAHERRLVVS